MSHPRISRRNANYLDAQRIRWADKGDGNNRAAVRKAITVLPRKVRMERRELMTHRQDLAALRQHALAGGNEETTVRNRLKAQRKARRS